LVSDILRIDFSIKLQVASPELHTGTVESARPNISFASFPQKEHDPDMANTISDGRGRNPVPARHIPANPPPQAPENVVDWKLSHQMFS
jgi:hypothetical protein